MTTVRFPTHFAGKGCFEGGGGGVRVVEVDVGGSSVGEVVGVEDVPDRGECP